MKTTFAIFTNLLFTLTFFAQDQYGLVREQNSNNRPISNVQIRFIDAIPTTTDNKGLFKLAFEGKSIGEPIFLEAIKKYGYELVNEKEIQILKIGENNKFPKDILLAKEGTIAINRKKYYSISDEILNKKFEIELKTLKQKLNNTKITKQKYQENFVMLNEVYEKQQQKLHDLANTFARINFDDVSEEYQAAFKLFEMEKVDEALKILENLRLIDRTKKRIDERMRLNEATNTIAKQEKVNENEIKKDIQGIQFQAELYELTFQENLAEALYDRLIDLDSSNLEILQKASNFYKNQNLYKKSKRTYLKIVAHPQSSQIDIVFAEHALGNIYEAIGDLDKALMYYNRSLSFYQSVKEKYHSIDNDPRHNEHSYFALLNNRLSDLHLDLGNLSLRKNRNDDALNYITKGYRFAESAYINDSMDLDNLISFYQATRSAYKLNLILGRFDKALKHSLMSLIISEKLISHFSNESVSGFKDAGVRSVIMMGVSYMNLAKLDTAFYYSLIGNKMAENLIKRNPNFWPYKNLLIQSIELIASIYLEAGQIEDAKEPLEQTLQMAIERCAAFPDNVDYKSFQSMAHGKLGIFYFDNLISLDSAEKHLIIAEKLLIDLRTELPNNIQCKQMLDRVQPVLEKLVERKKISVVETITDSNSISNEQIDSLQNTLRNLSAEDLAFSLSLMELGKVKVEGVRTNKEFQLLQYTLGNMYHILGLKYYEKGKIEKANDAFSVCLDKIESIIELNPNISEFQVLKASCVKGKATIFISLEQADKALQYLNESKILFKSALKKNKINEQLIYDLSSTYKLIGEIEIILGNVNNGLSNYLKYLTLVQDLHDTKKEYTFCKALLADANLRIGSIHHTQTNEPQKALQYYRTSKSLLLEIKNISPDEFKKYKNEFALLEQAIDELNGYKI